MDLRLTRIQTALSGLGAARPGQASVQVVGTNGKGSTCVFVESLCLSHGVSVGLFTSPHFLSPRERIRVNGRAVAGGPWLEAANAVAAVFPGAAAPGGLTYFELLTAMAARIFIRREVQAAVIEAGLGAAHDATTAFDRDIVLFTPIARDHEGVIGPDLAAIARDKVQAMRPGMTAISAPQEPVVKDVLMRRAEELSVSLTFVPGFPAHMGAFELGLDGDFQRVNAALALAGFLALAGRLGIATDPEKIREGLARAFVPGRMQPVAGDPPLILDAAHNPHALAALGRALAAKGIVPRAVIFACMKDKDVAAMVPLVAGLSPGPVILAPIPGSQRAASPRHLARMIGSRAKVVPDLATALASLRGLPGPVLACGSLYLLAAYYALAPRALTGKSRPRLSIAS